MRLFLFLLFLCGAGTAQAEGLRAKDIIGISPGMSVEQVQDKIKAYNPAMVIQRVNTEPTEDLPAYTSIVQGDIPGAVGADSPQDEISVRFTRHADGSVLSSAASHLVRPLPDDQRVLFKAFVEKLIAKYGPISNTNQPGTDEVRWVFDAAGSQKLSSLASDVPDYKRCSGILPYLGNITTMAGLPDAAMADCSDFLYVKMFPLDAGHADILAGYYMTYVNQDKYLRDLTGEDKANKDTKDMMNYKKLEEQKKALQNNAGPKL